MLADALCLLVAKLPNSSEPLWLHLQIQLFKKVIILYRIMVSVVHVGAQNNGVFLKTSNLLAHKARLAFALSIANKPLE